MGMDGSIILYDKKKFEDNWRKIARHFNDKEIEDSSGEIIVLTSSLKDANQICEYLHSEGWRVCSCESPFVYGDAVFFYSGDCMSSEAQELTYSVSEAIPSLIEKELWT